MNLLLALNRIAVFLQRSAHSEDEVLGTFRAQLARHGLSGSLSLLAGAGQDFVLRAVTPPGLTEIERQAGWKAEDLKIPVPRTGVLRELLDTGKTIYLPENNVVFAKISPALSKSIGTEKSVEASPMPGILAPVKMDGQILGVLNMFGPWLSP